jgi:hypothetical protein
LVVQGDKTATGFARKKNKKIIIIKVFVSIYLFKNIFCISTLSLSAAKKLKLS